MPTGRKNLTGGRLTFGHLETKAISIKYYKMTYSDKKVYQHNDKFDRVFTNNILSILQFVLVLLREK